MIALHIEKAPRVKYSTFGMGMFAVDFTADCNSSFENLAPHAKQTRTAGIFPLGFGGKHKMGSLRSGILNILPNCHFCQHKLRTKHYPRATIKEEFQIGAEWCAIDINGGGRGGDRAKIIAHHEDILKLTTNQCNAAWSYLDSIT